MKNVKSINFIFENCEQFEIEAKYFGAFDIDDIRESIYRTATNSISKVKTAYSIAFEIFAEANTNYSCFGIYKTKRKFDRVLEWKDITSVTIKYTDDTEDVYRVDYSGNDDICDQDNGHQNTYISSLGNLYITIARDKTVFDFFDKEEIEDPDHMEYIKTMLYN